MLASPLGAILPRTEMAAVFLAVLFSCASTSNTITSSAPLYRFRPGSRATPPRPQGECATHGPAYPEQAARDRIAGPVIVDLTVDESGHAVVVEAVGENAPVLLEAVERWAKACAFAPGSYEGRTVPMQVRKVYQLHPTREVDLTEPPAIELRNGDHVSRPEPIGCVPAAPSRLSEEGALLVSYVVHRGGYADSVRFGHDADPDLTVLVEAWIGSCTFRPARAPDGSAIAVRVEEQVLAFDDPVLRLPTTDPEGTVRAFVKGGELTQPQVVRCDGPRPSTPEEARQMGIQGAVVMTYVVHADGHVGEIAPLNPRAPALLANSVRQWLLSCRFDPAKDASGASVTVRIVQPYLFKLR